MARPIIYYLMVLLSFSWQTRAFFTKSSDIISPADTPYTEYGPVSNLTTAMIQGYGEAANSFWIASYLSAENGHDYFSIACHSAAPGNNISTYVLLLDITSTQYYGTNVLVPGTIPNTTLDINGGGLRIYSASEDLYSIIIADSSVPGAVFNLTNQPQGPNLYHAASGLHYWGTGVTNQFAYPNMWVTGTITVNGTETKVIPEKSRSWLDRQWGNGLATAGWNWFDMFLDNGVTVSVWHTNPIEGIPKTSDFATVLYPDGHHEIHIIDEDIHPSGPFISKDTNFTYHSSYQINIPTLNATIDARLPIHVGEMTYAEAPTGAHTLFESYTEWSGVFKGEVVSGFGLTEQTSGVAQV